MEEKLQLPDTETKQSVDLFAQLGSAKADAQEIQAQYNREQLREAVKEAVDLANSYFDRKDELKAESVKDRAEIISLFGITRGQAALDQHEASRPSATLVFEENDKAGVYAHLERSEQYDRCPEVVLSPIVGGRVVTERSIKAVINPQESDDVYVQNPVTLELVKHNIHEFDEGDMTYAQVAQGYLACVANLKASHDSETQ